MSRKPHKPILTFHKASGQARVRINGHDHYCGKFGTADARQRYNELIRDWQAGMPGSEQHTLSVDDLALRYLDHCRVYYRKDGEETGEVKNIRGALRVLIEMYGETLAAEFRTASLKLVRQRLIERGHVRSNVNRLVGRIRSMFRWGVDEELVPDSVIVRLMAVKGLKAARTEALESERVKPVAEATVEATLPFLTKPLRAVVRLQMATGARPGEILQMRAAEINMSVSPWEYRPRRHKTQHHGKDRVIYLGPRAQEIIKPFLTTSLEAYLFRPADGRAEYLSQFKGPGRPHKKRTKTRQASERYSATTFCVAITRACEVAFDMPVELRRISKKLPKEDRARLLKQASEWRAANTWHPHQLRHSRATEIRRTHGLDAARTVLGHSSLGMADHYAELDQNAARDVMNRIG